MKQAQITDRELIAALKHMAPETGSLLCLGCGHERRCTFHGCEAGVDFSSKRKWQSSCSMDACKRL